MSELIYIALGGNLGNVPQTFQKAIEILGQNGLHHIVCSQLHETEPVGCPEGTPNFLNAVIRGEWNDTPQKLLEICQAIEVECGRPRLHEHWVSRTLDLDILLFGNQTLCSESLTIPHPLMHERDFVLIPLKEVLISDEKISE